jgi:hypothetical protein
VGEQEGKEGKGTSYIGFELRELETAAVELNNLLAFGLGVVFIRLGGSLD